MTEEHAGSLPPFINVLGLLVSLLAGLVVFLPFASDTSPFDAVMLRVPGNQGNWWHALVGAPFFLAFPMIWIRVRLLATRRTPTDGNRRLIWTIVGLSIGATISVETPFLLHLAGTSEWQRLTILCLGFGIVMASGAGFFFGRRRLSSIRASLIGLSTAYLADAALCLVVYSSANGPVASRLGWLITMIIVWPITLEMLWIFLQSLKLKPAHSLSRQN